MPERKGLPWVNWTVRETIWGLVAGFFLSLIAPIPILPFDPDLDSLAGLALAQILFSAALIGTAVYIARRPEPLRLGLTLARLGWRPFAWTDLLLAVGVWFTYVLAVGLYATLVTEPKQEDVGGDFGLHASVLGAIVAIVLIVAVAPVAEETFFRGFVFGGLRTRLSRWPAAIVSGLIFGGVHAPEGPTIVIPLALLGIALAFIYDETGSLWPGVLLHAANNGIALAIS